MSVDNGKISLFSAFPVVFQAYLRLFGLGKNQEAGCMLVQPMDHINEFPRLGITLTHIHIQRMLDRVHFLPLRAHGKITRGFVPDNDRVIFVNDLKALGLILGGDLFNFRHRLYHFRRATMSQSEG